MKKQSLTRRELFTAGGAVVGAAAFAQAVPVSAAPAKPGYRFCLNTSTIRGFKLPIEQEIEITAKAGYDAIEPWVGGIKKYQSGGGKLSDLKKRIEDAGITVESAISFPRYMSDDDTQRAKGMEDMKRDMDLLAQIGGTRIAAPPSGATREPGLDLFKAAERYRAVLELGDEMSVVPQIEVWGFSKNLSRLGEAVFVAVESGHPKACVLGDVYHIYKGGSDFPGLKLLSAHALQVFHMNDYPADPPRDQINDSDRVYPGDGVAPVTEILREMQSVGAMPVLSLELFNKSYWQGDPRDTAKTGLAKMKACVPK